jgi:hypothetical protein
LPPLLAQWLRPVPRITADAIEYYSLLHTLYCDRDLHLDNEYEHFGVLGRWDKTEPTATGYRRTMYPIGPALAWLPFFALGDGWARLTGAVADGYSEAHIRAATLGSLVYGLIGLALVLRLLRRLFDAAIAFWSVFLCLYATFLYWYVVHDPIVSHAVSFCLGAAIVSVWWGGRGDLTWRRAGVLGLLIGLAALMRWQTAVFLALPGLTLLGQILRRPVRALVAGVATAGGFVLGVVPQLVAWRILFGVLLFAHPPQGPGYVRLSRPYLVEMFFSSRHGLFYWTPVLWLAFLGLVLLWRRARGATLALLAPLLATTYVNACVLDWWAGGSFSNRRFDTVLPILAIGLAASLEWLRGAVARRPLGVLGCAALLAGAWNVLLAEQLRRAWLPPDETVTFERLAHGNARLVRETVGTPLAWPANWLFAWRHGLHAGAYDQMVGRYLFYRQESLQGHVDVGMEDRQGDLGSLGEGWSPRRRCEDAYCREIEKTAAVLVDLDEPEPLELAVRASGNGTLTLASGGRSVTAWALTPALGELRASLPAAVWRRGFNRLDLSVSPGGLAAVDRLVFAQHPRPDR